MWHVRLLGFIGCILCSACALVVKVPTARLESPEAIGKTFGTRVGIGLAGTSNVNLANDPSARPPNLSEPKMETGYDGPARVGLGLGQRFEVGVRYGALSNAYLLTGKAQLLGPSRIESKPGDVSLAATYGFGRQKSEVGGNQNGRLGAAGYNWSSEVTTTIYDYALIAGYRLNETGLFYGGPYFMRMNMSGTIHHALSDNGTSPAVDYPQDGNGQAVGANLAYQYSPQGRQISLTFELVYVDFSWTAVERRRDVKPDMMFEFFF